MSALDNKPEPKRQRLLDLIVGQKEDFLGARLDQASIRALRRDIAKMPTREVERVLEQYEPSGPRYVWLESFSPRGSSAGLGAGGTAAP